MFLVYKLKTFKNCKEVKQIMIMIIVIIYVLFLSYMILDQQLRITCRKSSIPPEKIHYPLFTQSPPPKIQNVQVHPFLPTLKMFQPPPPAERRGGHCVYIVGTIQKQKK